jgi:ketosteroid isomerase-like protein
MVDTGYQLAFEATALGMVEGVVGVAGYEFSWQLSKPREDGDTSGTRRAAGVEEEPMAEHEPASVETLRAITAAFNAHDLDAIMQYFDDECSLDMPRGPDPWGQRFVGKTAVREGLAMRFNSLPDVHYSDDRHWVSGHRGVSEWLLTGTTPDGRRVRVRGCDHWEFRQGKVVRKDSYWKIVETPL